MRGNAVSAKNARKTHCIHDHPFDEANTGRDKRGHRYCKACALIRNRKWRSAQAAHAKAA
jgi:hypothetical protein